MISSVAAIPNCGGADSAIAGSPDFRPERTDFRIEIDQAFGGEHRDALSQQLVQELAMSGPEVGQGMVIDRDIAADPLIGGMATAELIELPGAADAVDGGVEPQGHEDLGIDGWSARSAVDGLDGSVQGTEVQSLDIIPDRASGMVGREQVVEGRGSEDDLFAVGGAESRLAAELRWLSLRHGPAVIGGRLEERRLFGTGQVGGVWSVHGDSIAINL